MSHAASHPKKNNSTVTESQNEYLKVLDEIPALIWRSGLDSKCYYFNPGWLTFTGRTLEQEMGDGWVEGVHPEDVERCFKTYSEAFQQREPFEMEYRLRHCSGEYRWILDIGRPIIDAFGQFSGYLGTCFDLTERNQMLQALRDANHALEDANAALCQREAMFKGLFEHSPDALIGVDPEERIVLVNKRAEKMFGYPQGEMIGRPASQFVAEAAHNQQYQDILRQLGRDEPLPEEINFSLAAFKKDGSTFPANVKLGTLKTENGPIILATVRDVTEQHRAEEVIRERETLLTTAAMSAPVVFFKIDQDGIIRFSLGQSLARRLENIDSVDRSIFDVYKSFPQVLDAFKRALDGETVTCVIEAAGLIYEATYAPMRDVNGEITSVVGVASDVTRHRKVEEALRKSESHFRTIFKDAILGIKVIDLQGRIVDSNPALQEMLGFSAEELKGLSFADLTHPEDTPIIRQMLDEFVAGKRDHFRVEKRYLDKQGQVIWGNLAMSLFRSGDGTPLYGIGMIENITAQKQVEAELAELQRRLADGVEAERLHLSLELHDGPLQELQAMMYRISFLEAIVQDEEGLSELEALQEEMRRVAQSLRSICGDLRPPALAPFGLERAIRSHAEQFQEQHPEVKVHLNLTKDGKELSERARLALYRIYQHSMANIVRHAQATNVHISFDFDDERIELGIEDDGQGFHVPRRRIELVRQGHFGVVGAIERAESVGGRMDIRSNPGEGTRIWVTVPRREEDQITPKERFRIKG